MIRFEGILGTRFIISVGEGDVIDVARMYPANWVVFAGDGCHPGTRFIINQDVLGEYFRLGLLVEGPKRGSETSLEVFHVRQAVGLDAGQRPVKVDSRNRGCNWGRGAGLPTLAAWHFLRGYCACRGWHSDFLHAWGGEFIVPSGTIFVPDYFERGSHGYVIDTSVAEHVCVMAGVRMYEQNEA